jgi:hypothetical protein
MAPMPLPCAHHSVSVLDGYVIYIVGAGNYGQNVLRFDTASGVWSTLGATSDTKRRSATFVLGGCLYVASGEDRSSSVHGSIRRSHRHMLEKRFNFGAVIIGSAQDLFDSLIAKAVRESK